MARYRLESRDRARVREVGEQLKQEGLTVQYALESGNLVCYVYSDEAPEASGVLVKQV